MNRLTHWNGKKYILPQGAWREIAERLAAYENTGLEPEEIEALKPKREAKRMSKLHLNVYEEMGLSEIVAGIRNGKVKLSVGDAVTTCLKSGKEIDFVVTDIDDEAYRFESRDCLGRYVPATELEGFLAACPPLLRSSRLSPVTVTRACMSKWTGTRRCKTVSGLLKKTETRTGTGHRVLIQGIPRIGAMSAAMAMPPTTTRRIPSLPRPSASVSPDSNIRAACGA